MKTKLVGITEEDIKVGGVFYNSLNSDTLEVICAGMYISLKEPNLLFCVCRTTPTYKMCSNLSVSVILSEYWLKKVEVRENWINIHPDTHHIISVYPHATEELAKQQVGGANYIQVELNL